MVVGERTCECVVTVSGESIREGDEGCVRDWGDWKCWGWCGCGGAGGLVVILFSFSFFC